VLEGAGLPLPVEQGNLHAFPRQPVLLEKRAQVAPPLLAPMVSDDPSGLKLDQGQPAPPDDELERRYRVYHRLGQDLRSEALGFEGRAQWDPAVPLCGGVLATGGLPWLFVSPQRSVASAAHG
jgi:hypothetical protein